MNLKNLKRIYDSLIKTKEGWVYHSYKYESKLFLEEGGVRPIVGQVGRSKDGITFKLMKVVPSVSNEGEFSADEVQEVLKRDWDKIKNVSIMFDDLLEKFKYVLSLNAKAWSSFYNINRISVSLRIIDSSSSLAQSFCEFIPETLSVGGVSFNFKVQSSFEKGTNPKFDRESYKNYLMTKDKNPLNEKDAEKASLIGEQQWLNALERAQLEGRGVSLSKDINPSRRYLIEYAKDFILKKKNFSYDSLVDIVIDDFTTTGISLRKMVEATKIEDGTAIGVALFTK